MNNELRDIAIALSKMQKDIRSIAEKLYSQTDDFIVQIQHYHDAGLSDGQIETLLGVDYFMVRNIVDRYEQDKKKLQKEIERLKNES